MAFTNLSFEDAGASPGLASAWTLSVTSTAVEIAGYSDGVQELGWEGFEAGWSNAGWQLAIGAVDAGEYGVGLVAVPPAFEAFSVGWDNVVWLLGLGATAAAEYSSAPLEGFALDWSNNDWQLDIGSTNGAEYGGDKIEDFEIEWANDDWQAALGAASAASFDGASPELFEDFEEVVAPLPVTVDPGTETFTAPAHGLANGTLVRWSSTGQPPGGINPALDYYVVGATTNTLQLARMPGGTAVAVDHQGSGAHALIVDPFRYWNDIVGEA